MSDELIDWDAEDAPERPYEAAYGYAVFFKSKWGYGCQFPTFSAGPWRAKDKWLKNHYKNSSPDWSYWEARGCIVVRCTLAPVVGRIVEPKSSRDYVHPGEFCDKLNRPEISGEKEDRARERVESDYWSGRKETHERQMEEA